MPEPKQQLKDYEEQRELGMTWFLIGIMFWLFAGLVLFFNPAALKLKREPLRALIDAFEAAVGAAP